MYSGIDKTGESSSHAVEYSIVIATYNRAESLRETLRSLTGIELIERAEVVIVDNNSDDQTKEVVDDAKTWFPTEIRYLFEAEQGRSAALNAGILACSADIILTTDDDVRLDQRWIPAVARAFEDPGCDYVGGKVLPIWESQRPAWLPAHGGKHWAVVGLLDYGPERLKLGGRVPIGVNMAFRRRAFTRAGMWNNRIGRRGKTLLGQEVREWGIRGKAAGLNGFYIPDMIVHHIVPASRLKKRYFRKWFYWHGVSRAILFKQSGVDMESPEATTLDFSKVPQIIGVPRYMYRTCLRKFTEMMTHALRGNTLATFESELWLWFFAGIVARRWKDKK
jgi:glycosyltransferase involved in cell wall biosynthesis